MRATGSCPFTDFHPASRGYESVEESPESSSEELREPRFVLPLTTWLTCCWAMLIWAIALIILALTAIVGGAIYYDVRRRYRLDDQRTV